MTPEVAYWGLDGFVRGEPVTLYHGTTRLFKAFDLRRSREALVGKYYGAGVFLTPAKRVAWKYAYANRNIGFEPSIIADLKRKNPGAGRLLEHLVRKGRDAWDDYTPEKLGVPPEQFHEAMNKTMGGVDPNTIQDIASYVIGSKVKPLGDDDPTMNLFSITTGMPEWVYKALDEIGLDARIYRPKVYTVEARAKKVLVTSEPEKARKARRHGYDGVVYYGPGIVEDVPEVALFNAKDAQVKGYELD